MLLYCDFVLFLFHENTVHVITCIYLSPTVLT